MKLTITQLGTPKEVQTKFGTKEKNFLKAQEYGDKYLNFWLSSATRVWRQGDVIEVQDVTSREYNGKTYYDIVMPKTSGGVPPEIVKSLEELNGRTLKILLMLEELGRKILPEDNKIGDLDYPEEDTSGIPF